MGSSEENSSKMRDFLVMALCLCLLVEAKSLDFEFGIKGGHCDDGKLIKSEQECNRAAQQLQHKDMYGTGSWPGHQTGCFMYSSTNNIWYNRKLHQKPFLGVIPICYKASVSTTVPSTDPTTTHPDVI